MSVRLTALLIVIALFGVLTSIALMDVGYLGIIEPHFRSWGAGQVFADLAIVGVLACVWMVDDARRHHLNPWPFVALTVVGGSFGPLCYLVLRERRAAGAPFAG